MWGESGGIGLRVIFELRRKFWLRAITLNIGLRLSKQNDSWNTVVGDSHSACWSCCSSYSSVSASTLLCRIESEFYLRRTPSLVTIHPVVLFSILDHYLRRTDSQDRVIGTLLGTRSESDVIEVKSSFAVLHSETSEQVAVDMDYHKAMYELHHKVNPREVIVGWCAPD